MKVARFFRSLGGDSSSRAFDDALSRAAKPNLGEQLGRSGVGRQTWRMSAPVSVYSANEERANILTHALGTALSLAGLWVLVSLSVRHGDGWHLAGAAVFGISLVTLYAISTLYHLSRDTMARQQLRKWDHAGIFLLIAGSYTPFLLVTLRSSLGWSLFAVVWGLGFAGIALKFWFAGHFRILSTAIYIGMGWLVLLVLRPLLEALPMPGVWLLVAGGLSYTFGAAFYLWRKLPYHHAIWHLFVIGGSVCHWYAVYEYVVPRAALTG